MLRFYYVQGIDIHDLLGGHVLRQNKKCVDIGKYYDVAIKAILRLNVFIVKLVK